MFSVSLAFEQYGCDHPNCPEKAVVRIDANNYNTCNSVCMTYCEAHALEVLDELKTEVKAQAEHWRNVKRKP